MRTSCDGERGCSTVADLLLKECREAMLCSPGLLQNTEGLESWEAAVMHHDLATNILKAFSVSAGITRPKEVWGSG